MVMIICLCIFSNFSMLKTRRKSSQSEESYPQWLMAQLVNLVSDVPGNCKQASKTWAVVTVLSHTRLVLSFALNFIQCHNIFLRDI